MGAMASQITSLTDVYRTDIQAQIKENTNLRVTGLCVNFPHKWPVTQKVFPFDDVNIEPLP